MNTKATPDRADHLESAAGEPARLFGADKGLNGRLVSIFGENTGGRTVLHYLVDLPGHGYQDFEYAVAGPVRSLTPITPAASWHEREVHECFNVEFTGHPVLKPLLHHASPTGGGRFVPDDDRVGHDSPFLVVEGEGVCEVPVGPVHAGIIEPGHFRFSVVGDTVLHLQLKLFYTHKGTEKLFEDKVATELVPFAESVSGDNCFAHAVAYCQALEQLQDTEVPAKANAIRLIGLETERLLAHIGDFGALCGDVGFSVPAAYCARIKEDLLRASASAIGTRHWRGVAVQGGVRQDIVAASARQFHEVIRIAAEDFFGIAEEALNTPSVEDRFEEAGVLARSVATDLAVVGPVARACGIPLDVRRGHPYGAYKALSFDVPTWHSGDVMARARIRIEEARTSARLILDCLQGMPEGRLHQPLSDAATGAAFAAVESPRGELLYWLRLDEGRIKRCHVRSPSFQNWPSLPLAVAGNIIADFPLINKSFNLSYSGCDR
jgi:Ni,Fe-hydrogenase III large subunit